MVHASASSYPKTAYLTLSACLLIVLMLCLAQIYAVSALIAATLAAFLILTAWSCGENLVLPVLLFFLPWSPLLKLTFGGISFFTIGLLLTCTIYFFRCQGTLSLYQVMLTALLAVLSLAAKLIQGNGFANSYIFFFAMLLLFPCVTKGSDQVLSLWTLTIFFACGIITAAISAQQIARLPNISRFIKVDSYLTITRLSGYYRDPNFYSAHITSCLAGIQILLSREKTRIRQLVLAVLAVLLIYCGLLSASKTFVVVSACLFFIWIPILMEHRSFGSSRVRVLVGILCAGFIVFTSNSFRELLRIMDTRFAYAANVSQLTTGRTEIWRSYIHELSHNLPLALLGEGFTAVTLNTKASHNTLLQGIFQFGLLGFPVLCVWLVKTLRHVFVKIDPRRIQWKFILLTAVGTSLPWMGLDILFFDEFFLLPVYAALAAAYPVRVESGKQPGERPPNALARQGCL